MTHLHPYLAAILAKAPSYYNAVADAYVARIASSGYQTHTYALDDAFYNVVGCPPDMIDADPSRGERMLVRQLAKVPRI